MAYSGLFVQVVHVPCMVEASCTHTETDKANVLLFHSVFVCKAVFCVVL